MDKHTQFQIIDRASFHRLQVTIFVYSLPIYDLLKVLFQDHIQLDTGRTSITFHEGVGDVHFHVFGNNFLKGPLGHFFNSGESFLQIQTISKTKIPLGNIYLADNARKIIYL